MGYEAVKAAVAAIKGEYVERIISTPVKVITAKNAQEYLNSLT
jgi:ABC-type sugar transport system substrate-binding protein